MAVNIDFNRKISYIILLMAVLAAISAFYLARSRAIPHLNYTLIVALAAMSFFMMFSLSRPLWALAPELHFVQFPWRYAVPFSVAFCFLVGAAVGKSNKLALLALGLFVFAGPLGKIVLALEKPSTWRKADISAFQRSIDKAVGYRGTLEYLPNGCNRNAFAANLGSETGINREGSKEVSVSPAGRNTFAVRSLEPQKITLNRFDYPTWQLQVDGTPISSELRDAFGRIVVPVPAGDHQLHMIFRSGWDAKLGSAISIATAAAVLLSFLAFLPGKVSKRQAVRQTPFQGSGVTPPMVNEPAVPLENQP
jgi:hypothetical protein